ncbi:hypothetical protein HanRHA438_Chr12g0537911 [Helianthus annuus]|nr:hypothetical protein HanRHA438_Chr12g0537911 [Helianthus annuus]
MLLIVNLIEEFLAKNIDTGTSEMEQIFGDNKVMEEGLVKLILQLHFVDPDEDLVN